MEWLGVMATATIPMRDVHFVIRLPRWALILAIVIAVVANTVIVLRGGL